MGWVEQSGGHRGSECPYVEVRSTPRAQRARRRDKASWRFSGDQHPRYRPWHLGVPAALGKAPRDRKEEDMDLLCKRTRRPWKPHLRGSLKSWGSGGNSLFSPKRTSFSASLKKKKKKSLSITFTLCHPVPPWLVSSSSCPHPSAGPASPKAGA